VSILLAAVLAELAGHLLHILLQILLGKGLSDQEVVLLGWRCSPHRHRHPLRGHPLSLLILGHEIERVSSGRIE
jgi:hypothetical protein